MRKTNDFYKKAKNGDNLIITQERAILYDPERSVIIDVVPVTIDKTTPAPTPSGAAPAESPAPATSTAPVQ